MGISGIVDSIAGEMGLVGKQIVMNHLGVCINQWQNSNQLPMSAGFKS
jgi:hypothetical protein